MSLTAELGPQLPFLRRYARALTGSQTLGDAAVREVLEALLAAPEEFDTNLPPRQELYRVFHRLWHGLAGAGRSGGTIASLAMHTRQSLLLTTIEDFTIAQTASILGSTIADVTAEIAAAREAIADSLQSRVMIIEDEAIIALHLKSIVEDLGHDLAGISRTRSEAVAMAAQTGPELVLADISLADGSSGIDAVKDILAISNVPVIFITAFPERLLTGTRPEPTYLTSAASTPAALVMEDAAPNPRKHFDSPEALLADPELTDGDKQTLLAEWDSEIDGRLNAESEGMGVSDPLTARKEARLADEAGKVKSALTAITEKISDPG
jgi:CheY-like chemotaxis protein